MVRLEVVCDCKDAFLITGQMWKAGDRVVYVGV